MQPSLLLFHSFTDVVLRGCSAMKRRIKEKTISKNKENEVYVKIKVI